MTCYFDNVAAREKSEVERIVWDSASEKLFPNMSAPVLYFNKSNNRNNTNNIFFYYNSNGRQVAFW